MQARTDRFRHVVAHDLPTPADTMALSREAQRALAEHARHLENRLAGILDRHRGCRRYTEADLVANTRPARTETAPPAVATAAPSSPWGPTGPGTSAAHLVAGLHG